MGQLFGRRQLSTIAAGPEKNTAVQG